MIVYGAFNSVPDYHGPPATLKSLHLSLNGAIFALYPNGGEFRKWPNEDVWEGPDGFGLVRKIEVMP